MRALCTGDTHVKTGPTNEKKTGQMLLDSIYKTAKREACDCIVINGDLWDEKHGVNYEVLMMVKNWFLQVSRTHTIYYIRGNHEVSIKSRPEQSLVDLFSNLRPNIHVINEPQVIQLPQHNACVWMIPWFPPEDWIEYCKVAAEQARNATWASKRLLFSHIGLSEGTVSPSNTYTVNQKTRVEHLHSECYHSVLLSDYHIRQRLNSRVEYMGAPIPLAHGDVADQGVWVVDLTLPTITLTNVTLEGQELFPKYKVYELHSPGEIACLIDSPNNYVKVKVPTEFLGIAQEKFKDKRRWTISSLPQKGKVPVINYGRMATVKENDTEKILDIWLQERNLDQAYRALAIQYLQNAITF